MSVRCACGCGRITPVAKKTDRRLGLVKGEHHDFCLGHGGGRATREAAENPKCLPSLDEIAALCEQIRAARPQRTRRMMGEQTIPWTPPIVYVTPEMAEDLGN